MRPGVEEEEGFGFREYELHRAEDGVYASSGSEDGNNKAVAVSSLYCYTSQGSDNGCAHACVLPWSDPCATPQTPPSWFTISRGRS